MEELEKKSFAEIVNNSLDGIWSDGEMVLDVVEGNFCIYPMLQKEEKSHCFSNYFDNKVFTKAREVCYEEAITELMENGKVIKSPFVEQYMVECDKLVMTRWGENLFKKSNDRIYINNIKTGVTFKQFSMIITEEEKQDKWLVFDKWKR